MDNTRSKVTTWVTFLFLFLLLLDYTLKPLLLEMFYVTIARFVIAVLILLAIIKRFFP